MKLSRSFLLLLLLAFGLSGCAGVREKPVFSMALDKAPEAKRLVFPSASEGEVPRYLYLGELRGDTNLVRPEDTRKDVMTAVAKFFDIVIGEDIQRVMDRPQSGTVDARGRIFVTDIGRGVVFVFDEKVPEVSVWDKAEGVIGFRSPVGIAAGPDGQIFVADADLGLIARLDAGGNTLGSVGVGHLQRPNGVAYDPVTRSIYVADTEAHMIKVFGLEGNLLAEIGSRGEGPGEFNYPTHIAISQGKLYVTDTMNARVQVLSTATGEYLQTIGKRGVRVGNLSRPKGVATDSEGNVYVIESYFDYLLVYNRQGQFLMPVGGVGFGGGKFHLPAGVWVDGRDRVYVADMLNSRVAVFQFLGGGVESE